ncbi:putative reverse transcriptase zinc-binding domain-containing protein [Helianthus anomalus]
MEWVGFEKGEHSYVESGDGQYCYRRRNVNVDSLVCKLCGDQNESSEHLFTSCLFVSLIWSQVSNWCGV